MSHLLREPYTKNTTGEGCFVPPLQIKAILTVTTSRRTPPLGCSTRHWAEVQKKSDQWHQFLPFILSFSGKCLLLNPLFLQCFFLPSFLYVLPQNLWYHFSIVLFLQLGESNSFKGATWQEVLSGVSQGSALGLVLFKFVNNLDTRIESFLSKFAGYMKGEGMQTC